MCSRNGSPRLVGKSCIVNKTKEQLTFGAFMTVIRTRYPFIMQTFMTMDYFRNQLTTTQTASVNQITTRMLNSYEFFKPTEEEEIEFSTFVKHIDTLKSSIIKKSNLINSLLNKKMDEYFVGDSNA